MGEDGIKVNLRSWTDFLEAFTVFIYPFLLQISYVQSPNSFKFSPPVGTFLAWQHLCQKWVIRYCQLQGVAASRRAILSRQRCQIQSIFRPSKYLFVAAFLSTPSKRHACSHASISFKSTDDQRVKITHIHSQQSVRSVFSVLEVDQDATTAFRTKSMRFDFGTHEVVLQPTFGVV